MARSTIALQAGRLVQAFAALATSIFLARTIGPQPVGRYATLLAAAVLVQAIVNFGLEDLTLARGPLYGGDSADALQLYARLFPIRALTVTLLGIAGAAAWTGAIPALAHAPHLAMACVFFYAGLNSVATLGANIQLARLRVGLTTALDTAWYLGSFATICVVHLIGPLSLTAVMVTVTTWQLLVDVGYCGIALAILRGTATSANRSAFTYRESAAFWANGLLALTTGKATDILAMQAAGATPSRTAYYNNAYAANLTASQLLLQGVGPMLMVGLGKEAGETGIRGLGPRCSAATMIAAVLSGPILVFVALFPRSLLGAMYGQRFLHGAGALAILAVTSLAGRIAGGGTNQSVLLLARRQNLVLWVRGAATALNIPLDVVGFHVAGISGVAAASGICSLLVIVAEFGFARRFSQLSVPVVRLTRLLLPYLLVGLALRLLVGEGTHILACAATAGVALTVGSALLVITKPLVPTDVPASAPRLVRRALLLASVR